MTITTEPKHEINIFSSNLNLSDERDREYFMSTVCAHYEPSTIKTVDEIITFTDMIRKRDKEKRWEKLIEEIKYWKIPTIAGIIFIVVLLLLDYLTLLYM